MPKDPGLPPAYPPPSTLSSRRQTPVPSSAHSIQNFSRTPPSTPPPPHLHFHQRPPAGTRDHDDYADDDDDDDSSSTCSSAPSTTTTNNNLDGDDDDDDDDDEEEQEMSDFDDAGETSDEESLTDSGVSVSATAPLTKSTASTNNYDSKKPISTLIPKDSAVSLEDHLNNLPTSSTMATTQTKTSSTSARHLQKPKRRQRNSQLSVPNPDEPNHQQTAPTSPIIPSLFTDGDAVLYFPHIHEHTRPLPPHLPSTLVWKVCKYTPQVVRDVLRRTGFKLVKGGKDWVGYWGKHFPPEKFKNVMPWQKVNHFPMSFEVGRKDRLYENLMRGRGGGGGGVNGVKRRGVDVELRLQFASHPTWIVKPPASARGNGIKLVSKWKEVPKKRECIVSRYIPNPMLIQGRKFDLRLYVAVTSFDPLRVYLYKEGVVRFAVDKYPSSNIKNRFAHLTNYSIARRKKAALVMASTASPTTTEPSETDPRFKINGCKWDFETLDLYFQSLNLSLPSVMNSIKQLIIKTISSCNAANKSGVKLCVPSSLKASGEMDKGVKGRMVTDLFNLVGIKVGDCEEVGKWMGRKKPTPSPNPSTPQTNPESRQKQRLHLRSPHLDPLQHLLPTDIQCLKSTEDEFRRRGNFERLVPGPDVEYGYFGNVGYYDKLIGEWTRRSRNTSGVGLDGGEEMGAFVGPDVKEVPAAGDVSKDCFVVAPKAANVAVKEIGEEGVGSKSGGWGIRPTPPRTPKMMPWERSLRSGSMMMMSSGAGGGRSGAGTPPAVGRSTPHRVRSTPTPSGRVAEAQRNTPTPQGRSGTPSQTRNAPTPATHTSRKPTPPPSRPPKPTHIPTQNNPTPTPSTRPSRSLTITPTIFHRPQPQRTLINPSVLNLEPYDHPATPAASRPMPTKPHSHHPPQPLKLHPPRHLPPFTMTPEQPKGRLEPGDVVKFVSEMARLRSLQNAFRTMKRCEGAGTNSLIFGRAIGGSVREAGGERERSLDFIEGPGDEDGFVECGDQQAYQEQFEQGTEGYLPVGVQMGFEGLEQVSQIYGVEVAAAMQQEIAVHYMQQQQQQAPLYAPDPLNGMDVLDMNIYQMMMWNAHINELANATAAEQMGDHTPAKHNVLPYTAPTAKNTSNNTTAKPPGIPFPIPLHLDPLHKRHKRHNIPNPIPVPTSPLPSSISHDTQPPTVLSTDKPAASYRQVTYRPANVSVVPAVPDTYADERAHALDVEATEGGDSEEGGEGCCCGWDGG
ncbi:Tubulin polyglutamylase ttll4 [Phlyctochytrium planicorne]|nr:Tubulin polyglutamylase ttll4 [Phlyctochytrium planicorne]